MNEVTTMLAKMIRISAMDTQMTFGEKGGTARTVPDITAQ
jgi:hypothetical protein